MPAGQSVEHFMEEDERWQYGIFASAEEALDTCRRPHWRG
jgi:hypothetical protein